MVHRLKDLCKSPLVRVATLLTAEPHIVTKSKDRIIHGSQDRPGTHCSPLRPAAGHHRLAFSILWMLKNW